MTDTITAPAAPALTPEESLRYARHLILPEVGPQGQGALKAARVLIIGAGGLGSPTSLYLAAAGVGHLGLIDFDFGLAVFPVLAAVSYVIATLVGNLRYR